MAEELFSSWQEQAEDEPTWRDRRFVSAGFTLGGVIAASITFLTPAVDFQLLYFVYAAVSAALASLPLAGRLFSACRDRDVLVMTFLSLALALLGYLVLALQMAVLDAVAPSNFFWEGVSEPRWYDPEHFGVGLFVAWGVLLYTWKVYFPCAVITGWAMSFLISSRDAPDRG